MKNNILGILIGASFALGIPLGFIVLVSWWAEDRFGSGVVLMIWGGTLGLIAFTAGAFLAARISRNTLESVADFMDANAQTEKGRALLFREHARGEREAFSARAKLEVIDARRVDLLAQQRAGLLMDQSRGASWAAGEESFVSGPDDFQVYE